MKLAAFENHGKPGWAIVVDEDKLLDPRLAAGDRIEVWPSSLIGLLQLGPEILDRLETLAASPRDWHDEWLTSVGSVTLTAPIPRPPKVLGTGRNYRDHLAEIAEVGLPATSKPPLSLKAASVVVGPEARVAIPSVSSQLDYEGELAVVIGTTVPARTRVQFPDCVAGYTIANDLSLRDVQFDPDGGGVIPGKNFDGSLPLGPYLVTRNDISRLEDLEITTHVGEELRQKAQLSDMIFSVSVIISRIAQQLTLEPGDVIITGTPAGSGFAMKPPMWLRPGDDVSVTISGLGCLVTHIV